ncbi:hypothetical protein MMYC01_202314 [Madurella mycetomatis]|uniref:Uncharacterized protein n=1 Tax=Madurella mycetomatis TaxID=100816 RepID=A0A175WEG4_9PEZI|nr:hypothetical protein MMYC01_202314 [Madurella mycetomatis]
MDILFSPYGVGDVPKSAMAEVERRTEDLLKSSSFQRMLELEEKYKTNRLRGVQQLALPSSQSPTKQKDGPPPRPARPDTLSPEQNYLMLKIARRSVILPSLAITIPQPVDYGKRDLPSEGEDELERERHADIGTPTNSETFHKQVKFLAPEDDEDEDDENDGMSEQSSICQSPSWEGYGQRKKEKKLEAERRKKEKEQAEKEAKAAKKRNTARLSKPPPPPLPATASRDARAGGLTIADRSMSDPLLISQHLPQSSPSITRPEDVGRAASADDLQQNRQYRPAVHEVLSDSGSNIRHFVGGAKPNRERERNLTAQTATQDPYSPTIPHHLMCDSGAVPRQDLHRSVSEGPASFSQPSSPSFPPPRPEGRSPWDVCPPSASRTPMLRHASPSGRERGNTMPQGATGTARGHGGKNHGDSQSTASSNHLQGLTTSHPLIDGGRREGYVRYQRAQSTERAMATLADEQLLGSAISYYPPARSSSHPDPHTRRPSLSQEAKSATMKFVGVKLPSATRDDGSKSSRPDTQSDYFTFKAIPYSPSGLESSVPAETMLASPRGRDNTRPKRADERPSTADVTVSRSTRGIDESWTVLERPPTSQSSASSGDPSVAGSVSSNHSKKGRSLKDAAKAALNMSKGAQQHQDEYKPSVPMPPYFAFRARMQSRALARAETDADRTAPERPPEAALNPTTAHPVSSATKTTETGTQGGCRASEGSSSSSAYEDGSPLPSPATTPDTSRPQSAKDIPLVAGELAKEESGPFALQDDERTLRQSFDSSNSSTPRLDDSEARESIEMGDEDRWSRTALPIDIDEDAQSPTASVSNPDNMGTINPANHSAATEQSIPETVSASAQASNSGLSHRGPDLAISIPPRSKKRASITINSPRRSPVETSPAEQAEANPRKAHRRPEELPYPRSFSSPMAYSELQDVKKRETSVEKQKGKQQQKHVKSRELDVEGRSERAKEGEAQQTASRRDTTAQGIPGHLHRNWTSGSISSTSSTAPSSGSRSPGGSPAFPADFQIPSNPYVVDFPEQAKDQGVSHDIPRSAGPPSPISLPSPVHQAPSNSPAQPRAQPAPTRQSTSTTPSRTSTPAGRPPATAPVSILKQPKNPTPDVPSAASPGPRPHVLSALPKHMQLQAGISVRPLATAAETRMAPIAKMFVECCSCKFYHDMPSKIYECMAKPDAVVEDKVLGISGAITTMVKCPWCQHNMSRSCCAGYAAVVYLKEKLH